MICYLYPEPTNLIFSADLPGLLYYSHIPASVIALLIGFFVFFNGPKLLLNRLLLAIATSFSLWTFANLISWTNIHSDVLLFTWSFFGPLNALLAVFCVYFIYVFLEKKDAPLWLKGVFVALLAPVFALAPTVHSLSGFNITNCDAFGFEGQLYELYYQSLGFLAIAAILFLLVRAYRCAAKGLRAQIVLMGVGIISFLLLFFGIGYLSSYLTTIGVFTDSELEMYGLFGMVIFMAYMGVILVRFKTFNVSVIAPQALVVALVILIGAQFTFIRSTTNLVLTSIALILTGVIGIVLIRSVKREIEQRKRIEELAKDLEKSNKQQIILIHFITHQIKGFVTKSRNIFSMIKEGDCGPVPESMRSMVEEGFRSDTKGVNTIQEILNAANIKNGKVEYKKEPFDLKALVDEIAGDLRGNAEAKGLSLVVETGTEPLFYPGDRVQLTNAIKNLIDNSIKYTLKGEVQVSLAQEGKAVRFMIEDTGVGITPEDMQHLFTEGGHGANSVKVNVESTGFGLYIVKNIIEAHGGKVWAESEGEGKGSRFIAELPA